MSTPLRLEYACTRAELDEAQALYASEMVGSGSKWLGRTLVYGFLFSASLALWFGNPEAPTVTRALGAGGFFAFAVALVAFHKKFRKFVPRKSVMEISERDLTASVPGSRVVMPWSAFGKCLESPDLFVLVDRPGRTLLVFPKRAFPDDGSLAWFRERIGAAPAADEPAVPEPIVFPGGVTILQRLTFRDHFAVTVTSLRTLAMCSVVGILLFIVAHSLKNHRPEYADATRAAALYGFTLLLFLVVSALVVMAFAAWSWRSYAKAPGPQTISFADEALAISGPDGSATLPWATYEHCLESRWHFILWRGEQWLLLPKREFASDDELSRFRGLLASHLKPAPWFTG
jgi:hypothetical protein